MGRKKSNLQIYAERFKENNTERNFSVLTKELKPRLRSFLYKYNMDEPTLDMIISNTLMKVWKKIEQYDTYYAFTTWCYRIAINEFNGWKNKKFNKGVYSLETMDEDGFIATGGYQELHTNPDYEFYEPDENESFEILFNLVVEEIKNLPSVFRVVLEGNYMKKKTTKKISEETGVNENTIKSRMRRGKQLIKNKLTEAHPNLVEKLNLLV